MRLKLLIFTFVYNGTKYINNLFESLISQTNHNFIHYIYDDGSNDNLECLIKTYINKVNRLKTPYKIIIKRCAKNNGALYATEFCLKKIRRFPNCKYSCWINCDDWVEPNFVETVLSYCYKNSKDLIVVNTRCLKFLNGEYKTYRYSLNKNTIKTYSLSEMIRNRCGYGYFIFKIDFFIKTNPNLTLVTDPLSKRFYNDVQFYLMMVGNDCSIGFIDIPLFNFLSKIDSISYKNEFDMLSISGLESLKQLQKLVKHCCYDDIENLYYINNIVYFIRNDNKFSKEIVKKYIKIYKLNKNKYSSYRITIIKKIYIMLYLVLPYSVFKILK